MTPLIDVMLVLLVIFIITAPLLASSIKLDLPQTDAGKSGHVPKSVTLAIDVNGQVFMHEQALELAALAGELAQLAQRNPETEVQLRADKSVPYGRMVEVMGVAQKAGLNRIGFVTEAPTSPPQAAAPEPALRKP